MHLLADLHLAVSSVSEDLLSCIMKIIDPSNLLDLLEYVEVFPIEVKMDYKPKRIDFKAITKGKTAELLNLFHFEGSKMTLRHVTLNGVSPFSVDVFAVRDSDPGCHSLNRSRDGVTYTLSCANSGRPM